MGVKLTNNATTTIPASVTSTALSLTVASGAGARFPILGTGDYFYATLTDVNNNFEVVKVTARTDDLMVIVRAQEGTIALPFSANSRFELRVTAASIVDIKNELRDTVSVKDFGAVGNGIADDTAAIQAAVNAAELVSGCVYFPAGTYLVGTFTTALDSGTNCAVLLNGDLTIDGCGTISSATGSVSNSIFGIDGTSGAISLTLKNVKFAGSARYRAVTMTASAVADSVVIDGVETERQSIVLSGDYNNKINVRNCYVGKTITAATAVSPTITVTIAAGSARHPEYIVENNTVVGGTENASTGLFVIHGMPANGLCKGNSALNVGNSTTECFDIDNIGRLCVFDGNYALNGGYDYKPGTGGYLAGSEIMFSNNRSDNGTFALRSSCIAVGNISYNPPSYGLFLTPGSDSAGFLDESHLIIDDFKVLYAGAAWVAGIKIDQGFKSISLNNISVELDPEWATNNPSGVMPNVCVNIDGDVNNLRITNSFFDKSAGDHINFRPATTASNLTLDNVRFGNAGDSCIDLSNVNNVTITNPIWPATITDRPIRTSTCSKVRVVTDFKTNVALIYTSGSSTGVLINNLGLEAAGAGVPPSATDIWPVGCIVRNTSDSTVWQRISESTTPASAWVQVTTTYTPAGTGAVTRTVVSKLRETVSVMDFGAVGDGVTNDTAAIQAAIDYAASVASPTYPYRGAVVLFPAGLNFRCNSTLTLKSGVMLSCPGSGRAGGASITGFGATIIDTPVGLIHAASIDGVSLFGGSTSVRIALRLRNVRGGVFTNFTINNVQDQGILCDAGVINTYDNIFIVNALLDRTRSTPGGALETYDFDSMFSRIESTGATGGLTTVSSSNLYCNAILAGGSNGFWSQCIGQFGDVGIRILGDYNKFVNCRADTTMAHGIIDDGSSNIISACEVLNWAMDTTPDQYDAYQNFSQNGIVNGLVIAKTGGSRGRYGVNLSAFSEIGTRTSVSGVVFNSGAPNVIARYNVPLGADGVASAQLAGSGYITERTTSTTLDLSRAANMRLLPASAVSYTDVANAVPGQIYTFVLNSNATLVHNSSKIITKDGTNITGGGFLAVWPIVQFFAYSPTTIREIGR
jgi:hypothetical protein